MKENPFTKRSKILEENKDYLDHTVKTISKVFIEVIKNNGKLIFAGNGGSAAEAQHMSAEYVGTLVTSNKRNPIPSIALSTDTSFITAWSNDHGYEDIFRRQLQALANEKDCFVAYSTSGESVTSCAIPRNHSSAEFGFISRSCWGGARVVQTRSDAYK